MKYADFAEVEIIDGVALIPGLALYESDYKGPEIFQVLEGGRPYVRLDLLSYQHFDTDEYWKQIAIHNGIHDPFFELAPGQTVSIPVDQNLFRDSFYKLTRWQKL
jgi:hypothetical protein